MLNLSIVPRTDAPLYIFDLDGTLALLEHRLHFITRQPKDWLAFYEACDKDKPNMPVIKVMDALIDVDAEIWIVSGRQERVREKTIAWLGANTRFMWQVPADETGMLMMRPDDDFRPDDELKQEFLDRMLDVDRRRLVAVFEDRDKVVAMWRRNGITCFQVAPGAF